MLIDLSQPLTDGMPVYPGDPPVAIEQASRFPDDAWQLTRISLGCHAGTHIDAPRHFLPAGATLEQMALERFCGPGRLIAQALDGQGRIDATALSSADIRPGECLLIHTGWKPDADLLPGRYPVFTPGSGRHLAGLGIRMLALDLPTAEEEDEAVGAMHKALLGAGVVIVEGLANLEALAAALAANRAAPAVAGPGAGHAAALAGDRFAASSPPFAFYAMPLLIPGSEASPVRAFAEVAFSEVEGIAFREGEGAGACEAGGVAFSEGEGAGICNALADQV